VERSDTHQLQCTETIGFLNLKVMGIAALHPSYVRTHE
jgi:hypothetical protein